MIRLWKERYRRLGVTVVLVLLTLGMIPDAAAACSRCFGTSVNNATTFGISMAMLGLLGMLGVVWGGIGLFVWNVRKRSEMLEPGDWVVTREGDIEERDEG